MKLHVPYASLLLGPTALFGLGFLLNALVTAANHGMMPALRPGCTPGEMLSPIHFCMASTSHLKFLADWILYRPVGILSPGDFLQWFYDVASTPAWVAWVALVVKDYSDFRSVFRS